ncbi:Uncharacterised protein [Mycobacterium tuberculosis]|uniref:Uncharacterized protein n=1 Tax=Mycobacterium tuberculosis TaxID=1773 RepID=A0A655A4H6_MYCTX|nr:Uncharacterised protein [Mycobacterium tuberculosis]
MRSSFRNSKAPISDSMRATVSPSDPAATTASTGSTDTVIELIFECYRRHAPPAADKRTPVDKHPTVHERVI